jgi:hypothetical protein
MYGSMFTRVLVALLLFPLFGGAQTAGNTVIGIRGSWFTINGQPSYTPASGFLSANANLAGTLLNVRAVQAIFDDANYPKQGSRLHPYQSNTLGPIFWATPMGLGTRNGTSANFWPRCPTGGAAGCLPLP